MRDDYTSSEDEDLDGAESAEDENTEFLANGHDLDLPEEESDLDQDSSDESDREL